MTIRYSTTLRNKVLNGGASGGVKGAIDSGFIAIMSGSQPTTADSALTGTLLGTVSINGLGATGLTFDAATVGVLSKAAAEAWKFTGLAAGIAGSFRFYEASDAGTYTTALTTKARIDGSIGTSGADLNLTNITIAVSQVNTCDSFTITQPNQ